MNLIDLSGKNILVGVTGSIAIYKACELVRFFVKSGANVRVVMSQSAQKFITPLTFEAITRNRVLTEISEDWSSELNHIDYSQKSDAFVVAPATANTINKLAKGVADNILLQSILAFDKNLVIAPSANTQMLNNHYTEGSLKILAVNDIAIVQPQNKLLACGDKGDGALAEPKDIYYATAKTILRDDFWSDRRVVVTGGGTIEAIDSVRFIGNHSSGKMANSLALALYLKGADVCLITTKKSSYLPKDIYLIDVDSSESMLEYTVDAIRVAKKGVMSRVSMNNPNAVGVIQKTPYLYMTAAVADYKPKFPQDGKLKKTTLGQEWNLKLTQTDDILKTLNKDGLITIGFKAEIDSSSALKSAKKTIKEKSLDAICLNILKEDNNFGSNKNRVDFITKDEIKEIPLANKIDVALKILKYSKGLSDEQ